MGALWWSSFRGPKGESAYELAVANGFVGTEAEWLASLNGDTGATGAAGTNGWSPVLAVVNDGARRVYQVADWVGGSGSKPVIGDFIGASGFVASAALAVDVRGSAGATGPAATPGTPVPRSLSYATAYQASDNTKPAMVTAMIQTSYTISVAGSQEDVVDLVIGSTNAVASGTGTVVASFRASLTGIALTVGMAQISRNQLSALLPAGWFFALRRTTGTNATITSAFDQPLG